MRLEAGDELVLLNRELMPERTYSQVIEKVAGVPVDAKTRFSLVLLRRSSDQKLEWIFSSAIPSVDYETGKPDGKVIVEHLQYSTVEGPRFDDIHIFRLKVKGTDLYLKIDGGEVVLEVAKSADKDKYNIHVWTKCHLDETTGFVRYTACIYGDGHNLEALEGHATCSSDGILDDMVSVQYGYVTVTGDSAVTVTDTPQWFGYREEGRGQSYEVSEQLSWIACEINDFGASGKVCLKPNEFFFESYCVGSQDVNTPE